MGRQHKTFPEESNNDKEKTLRRRIKELEAEVKRLKGELKTLNIAFSKTAGYVKGNLDNFSVEKVIKAARSEKPMVEIQKENACPSCGEQVKESRLPFGRMRICTAACGFKEVIRDSDE